jgi:hypothetical protein
VLAVVATIIGIGIATGGDDGTAVPPLPPPTTTPASSPPSTEPGGPRIGTDVLLQARALPAGATGGKWTANKPTSDSVAFAAACGPADVLAETSDAYGRATVFERAYAFGGLDVPATPGTYATAAEMILADNDIDGATARYDGLMTWASGCAGTGLDAAGSVVEQWALSGVPDTGALLRLQVPTADGTSTSYIAIVRTANVNTLVMLRYFGSTETSAEVPPVTDAVHAALARLCDRTGVTCPDAEITAVPMPA